VILACFDPRADGDPWDASPNPDLVYLAVDDLETYYQRAEAAGASRMERGLSPAEFAIATQPWGERSFYSADPFGNKLCFVDESTLFTGHA
jgi:uncharacterized glyoxalase superfamily protein PhnB